MMRCKSHFSKPRFLSMTNIPFPLVLMKGLWTYPSVGGKWIWQDSSISLILDERLELYYSLEFVFESVLAF